MEDQGLNYYGRLTSFSVVFLGPEWLVNSLKPLFFGYDNSIKLYLSHIQSMRQVEYSF